MPASCWGCCRPALVFLERMRQGRTILVSRQTGQQGGSVARPLRSDGWKSGCAYVTRTATTPGHLSTAGIETVRGDPTDRSDHRRFNTHSGKPLHVTNTGSCLLVTSDYVNHYQILRGAMPNMAGST